MCISLYLIVIRPPKSVTRRRDGFVAHFAWAISCQSVPLSRLGARANLDRLNVPLLRERPDDLVEDAAFRDEAARGRLADLQDRIRKGEQRAMEVRQEMAASERERVDEHELATALSLFDPVWESLAPREQARVVQLLVGRVAYDGRDG